MMKKFLITGSSGFVGWHFLNYLESERIKARVIGVDLQASRDQRKFKFLDVSTKNINLLDLDRVETVLKDFEPDYILHLASFSSVAYSWENPVTSFQNNTNIFLNLVESVRKSGLKARILSVGSSEEYGNLTAKDIPIKETHALSPLSPYAVARVSQEMLSKVFANNYGLDVIMTRSFNHIGARQRETFVVPSFARQLVQIKRQNNKKTKIIAGNVSVTRDFVDVRDVVAAYYKLLVSGKNGEIYNVCSGRGVTLREVILSMAKILRLKVEIVEDQKLFRPNDNKIIIGSNDKIKKDLGWQPQIDLESSLREILSYWEREST